MTRFRRTLGVCTVALLVIGGCSSGDDDDSGDRGAGDQEPAAPVPGADVSRPTVTGPVTGGAQDKPWLAMPADVRDDADYVEEEYFLAGDATAYKTADGSLGEDGRWDVSPAGTAAYKTRVLVRRPKDADEFDGTVFVEWLNVTAGTDGDPDFGLTNAELLSHGSAYVGVSAQKAGIESGGAALPIEGVTIQALRQWDPERYGSLTHPGDQYSYDIFSQAAQAVRRPGKVDILGGLKPRHVIAMGESQSGARMVSYVNAAHPVAEIYDGFLIHSRGGGGSPLDASGSILGEGIARIRDDLKVPVLQFETETDLFGPLGFARARQDDTDLLRTWEVAGTAHADRGILDYNRDLAEDSGFDMAEQCGSINSGPQPQVVRAAVAALRAWVVNGKTPPAAPRLELSGEAIARDERGIALGGIRTPVVDAPISIETGVAPPGRSVICMLFGDSKPFDAATLAKLYPTHDDYVSAVTSSADAAVSAGFLLQADADAYVDAAKEAKVPS